MWIFRRTQRPPATQLRARLGLEALDLRLPPSSILDPTADALTPVAPSTDTAALVAPDGTQTTTSTADPSNTTVPQAPPAQSTTTVSGSTDGSTGSPSAPTAGQIPAPAPNPTIGNFQGVKVAGALWQFTGDVVAPAPGGLTVTFGGEPESLQGVTTPTDANGHFDMSMVMNTDGSDNGLASAQTTDADGHDSNLALYNISPG
jgi:hypothetical protein